MDGLGGGGHQVNGLCAALNRFDAALIHSPLGYDVSVHLVEKHSVRRGYCAPSIEMAARPGLCRSRSCMAALGSMATQARNGRFKT